MFTRAERDYIAQNPLGRIAVSTPDGKPHAVPLFTRIEGDKVICTGFNMAKSYKYRVVQKNPWVAVVWDSRLPTPPPNIAGIEVRGTAVIKHDPGASDAHFEVTPTKVFSWGINEDPATSFEKKMGFDMKHQRAGAREGAPDRKD
ncbi:MAG: hypothetical protein FJ318_03065 [SAR202 cluster bacterium]|nr:hypothetical protein [SAR202 cluster bacterium]